MPETYLVEEEIHLNELQPYYKSNPIYEIIINNWDHILDTAKSHSWLNYNIMPTDSSIMNWTIQNKLPEYFDNNFKILKERFNQEFESIHQHLTLSKGKIFEVFENVCKYIAQLEFTNGTVELTSSSNIKFTLLFDDNRVLMLTKYLMPGEFNFKDDDIVFSLFINKKLIASDVSEISYFISGFKKYLAM